MQQRMFLAEIIKLLEQDRYSQSRVEHQSLDTISVWQRLHPSGQEYSFRGCIPCPFRRISWNQEPWFSYYLQRCPWLPRAHWPSQIAAAYKGPMFYHERTFFSGSHSVELPIWRFWLEDWKRFPGDEGQYVKDILLFWVALPASVQGVMFCYDTDYILLKQATANPFWIVYHDGKTCFVDGMEHL